MGISLVRIDDRLVHGQVVEGWLRTLRLNHVIVVSDRVATDDTQKALYYLAVPQGVALECLTIAQAGAAWGNKAWEDDNVIVLLSSPRDTLELVKAGARISSVNVGGIHFRNGRIQVLKAVSLDDEDVDALKGLLNRGVALEARPLPLDAPVDLKPYLERWSQKKETFGEQPR